MQKCSRVGAPDALKGACPVRGGLGGIPLLKSSMDAALLLHTDTIKKGMKDAASAVKHAAEKGKDAAVRAVDKGKAAAVRGVEKVKEQTDQAAEKVKEA
jgi:hypothetical protein